MVRSWGCWGEVTLNISPSCSSWPDPPPRILRHLREGGRPGFFAIILTSLRSIRIIAKNPPGLDEPDYRTAATPPSLEPYFRADQIFTSVPGLSVEGQSKVETDNQVVAALRAGEKARLILFSGTGLLLLAVSCYGYRQTKKPPKAEPSGGGNPTTIRRP